MGSGRWDATVYSSTNSLRATEGKSAFAYSDHMTKTAPPSTWKVNALLDPNGVALRESRDSDEHPTSLAIAVLFDVTGSMRHVPREMQKRLAELFGLLLRKGYVEHPQILMGAIGDATCDRAPLQVGQFESDNRIDTNLEAILLEGGGGGSTQESYELAMYFMARHTAIDCFEKRGHRGYLFIIGDEQPYPSVKYKEVEKVIGPELEEAIPTGVILKELQEKYDVYLIRPGGASYRPGSSSGDSIVKAWQDLLGQNVIDLPDPDCVCETIALTIGLAEGAIDDLEEGLSHLKEVGSTAGDAVGKALATVGSKSAVSTGDGPADLTGADDVESV